MITKQKTYDTLVCFILLCFGFFGSLSHLFSLGLIFMILFEWLTAEKSSKLEANPIVIFISLTGCFFLFLFQSLFDDNLLISLSSLSPMLPISLIGLLIIFRKGSEFSLNSRQIAKYSQTSILISLLVYILLSTFFGPQSIFYKFHSGRVELFSGNPIPFSYVMLGISVFCLCDWSNSNKKNKISAFSLFLVGVFFSSFMSGTRGTLLSIFVTSPIIFYYLFKRLKLTLIITISLALFIFSIIYLEGKLFSNITYFDRISNGIETLIFSTNNDSSVSQRLQMWSASLKAISEGPFFGYGIKERFTAIQSYLPNSFPTTYSHPHNDLLASTLSIGYLGGLAGFFSLISIFLAALLADNKSTDKVCLSIILSISTLITANVSTVFFNDISSSWLAFSTYLIWVLDFKKKENFSKTTIS